MPNYFVSYDLNGQHPTHKEMDKHIEAMGRCAFRILETVWYVHSSGTREALYNYVNKSLSSNDRLIVIEAEDCHFRNLLVPNERPQGCWRS